MNKLNTFFFLSILFSLQGCIKEDLSHCLPIYNIDIQFDYHGDSSSLSIFDENIEQIDIYIYNNDCILVKQVVKNRDELNMYAGFREQLPVGEYTLVSIANDKEYTNISEIDNECTARIKAEHIARQTGIPACVDHIYSSVTDIIVIPGGITKKEVELRSSHINVNLYIKYGADAASKANNQSPIIQVNHLPEMMNFEMGLEQETTTYHPGVIYDQTKNMFASNFQTLRFTKQHPVNIAINDSQGMPIHTLDIQSFLKENNLLSVYDKQEASIGILIEVYDMHIKISIPDWGAEDLIPDS